VRVFFCGHPRVSAFVPVVSACGKQASSELTGTVSVSALAPLQAAIKSGIDDEDEMFKKLKYCANDPPVHQSKANPCDANEERSGSIQRCRPPILPPLHARLHTGKSERAEGRGRCVSVSAGA
jgi:hypothetical protein